MTVSSAPSTVPTRDRIRADVADVLDVPVADIDDDANLLDEGMDSVRVMALVERWRADGVQVDLVDLVGEPTLDAWFEVTAAR
ncbi:MULTISPECIES: phosphopantetheine-binding protein [Rhodococcus]|uniref:Isochorismatase n=1 Tax=Rhodococcus pseudokoreensis TaxID=2811421 RepID=A0A974W8F4_9NOCA|nr:MULTISPECIES: phosphopantetheine-binding protein [Rhodococcus]MBV6758674.1 isochorismatase [Rhodococcus opacus]QSE93203.1 isochorismatase [Rhodococcus pseudokoreensis]